MKFKSTFLLLKQTTLIISETSRIKLIRTKSSKRKPILKRLQKLVRKMSLRVFLLNALKKSEKIS